jgi:hypothetical protein
MLCYDLGMDCIDITTTIVVLVFIAAKTYLLRCCLAMAASVHSAILALSHHVTVRYLQIEVFEVYMALEICLTLQLTSFSCI